MKDIEALEFTLTKTRNYILKPFGRFKIKFSETPLVIKTTVSTNAQIFTKIASPKIENSVSFNYMFKIREEELIGEFPIRGLSIYDIIYNKEIFDSLDWSY